MKRISLKTKNLLIILLLCIVATAAVEEVRAQNKQKAEANQSGVKDKAAPKSRSQLDDEFSPKNKPQQKPSGQSGGGNKGTAASEDISDPLDDSRTPKTDSTPASTPAVASSSSTPTTNAAPPVSAPKKAGVTRICLVTPRAQMSAGDTTQAAEAVRNTFNSFLTGPTIETVALTARLPAQALEEARQSGCEYVLYTSLTHKKGGGGGGGFLGRALGDAASSAVWHIPGSGSTAGAVARSAAVSGVYTAASMASSIKAKDELILEYKLEATNGNGTSISKTEKAKAKEDGQDVLTPLIERAAGAIAAVVMKR